MATRTRTDSMTQLCRRVAEVRGDGRGNHPAARPSSGKENGTAMASFAAPAHQCHQLVSRAPGAVGNQRPDARSGSRSASAPGRDRCNQRDTESLLLQKELKSAVRQPSAEKRSMRWAPRSNRCRKIRQSRPCIGPPRQRQGVQSRPSMPRSTVTEQRPRHGGIGDLDVPRRVSQGSTSALVQWVQWRPGLDVERGGRRPRLRIETKHGIGMVIVKQCRRGHGRAGSTARSAVPVNPPGPYARSGLPRRSEVDRRHRLTRRSIAGHPTVRHLRLPSMISRRRW